MSHRTLIAFVVLATLAAGQVGPVVAGCGCDKPPPALAAIRPAFASPGDVVTLFPPDAVAGGTYAVKFKGDQGSITVTGVATRKRDFADGIIKVQVAVRIPALPPGPTRVEMHGQGTIVDVPRTAFTVLQRPLVLAQHDGEIVAQCYRAAVGSDGTVYLPIDVGAIAEHMIFSGLGAGYPLLFGAEDIAIYNTQGVLMQLLGPKEAGIYAITDPSGSPDSFALAYDRHEFVTYREEHAHLDAYGLDATDPAWHSDGTRHIDHDHLVLAIRGVLEDGTMPPAGATPRFDLHIATALADDSDDSVSQTIIRWSNACQ